MVKLTGLVPPAALFHRLMLLPIPIVLIGYILSLKTLRF